MSGRGSLSAESRLVAALRKAAYLPLPDRAGRSDPPLVWPPPVGRLTSVVMPVILSRRKMSAQLFVSPGTRLSALLTKTKLRPSAAMEVRLQKPFAPLPLGDVLTRSMEH